MRHHEGNKWKKEKIRERADIKRGKKKIGDERRGRGVRDVWRKRNERNGGDRNKEKKIINDNIEKK